MLLPGPRFSQLDAFAKVTTAEPRASVSVPPPVVTHCAAAAAFDVSNQSSSNRHAPVAFDGGGRITKDYNGIRYPRVPFVLFVKSLKRFVMLRASICRRSTEKY